MKTVVLVAICFLIMMQSGCARSEFGDAGPYVTDICFDDEGNLLVTKDTAVFVQGGPFSHLSNRGHPTVTVIKITKRNVGDK